MMPNSNTPFEEALGTMFEMQKEGKILHIGLSNVNTDELTKGLSMETIASVENPFGYGKRISFEFHSQQTRRLEEVMPFALLTISR